MNTTPTTWQQHPWYVLFRYADGNNRRYAPDHGGVLISPNHVLSHYPRFVTTSDVWRSPQFLSLRIHFGRRIGLPDMSPEPDDEFGLTAADQERRVIKQYENSWWWLPDLGQNAWLSMAITSSGSYAHSWDLSYSGAAVYKLSEPAHPMFRPVKVVTPDELLSSPTFGPFKALGIDPAPLSHLGPSMYTVEYSHMLENVECDPDSSAAARATSMKNRFCASLERGHQCPSWGGDTGTTIGDAESESRTATTLGSPMFDDSTGEVRVIAFVSWPMWLSPLADPCPDGGPTTFYKITTSLHTMLNDHIWKCADGEVVDSERAGCCPNTVIGAMYGAGCEASCPASKTMNEDETKCCLNTVTDAEYDGLCQPSCPDGKTLNEDEDTCCEDDVDGALSYSGEECEPTGPATHRLNKEKEKYCLDDVVGAADYSGAECNPECSLGSKLNDVRTECCLEGALAGAEYGAGCTARCPLGKRHTGNACVDPVVCSLYEGENTQQNICCPGRVEGAVYVGTGCEPTCPEGHEVDAKLNKCVKEQSTTTTTVTNSASNSRSDAGKSAESGMSTTAVAALVLLPLLLISSCVAAVVACVVARRRRRKTNTVTVTNSAQAHEEALIVQPSQHATKQLNWAPPAVHKSKGYYVHELRELYKVHKPQQAGLAEQIVGTWPAGKEEAQLRKIRKKYGVSDDAEWNL